MRDIGTANHATAHDDGHNHPPEPCTAFCTVCGCDDHDAENCTVCPLCGKPLAGEIGCHDACMAYEQYLADCQP